MTWDAYVFGNGGAYALIAFCTVFNVAMMVIGAQNLYHIWSPAYLARMLEAGHQVRNSQGAPQRAAFYR